MSSEIVKVELHKVHKFLIVERVTLRAMDIAKPILVLSEVAHHPRSGAVRKHQHSEAGSLSVPDIDYFLLDSVPVQGRARGCDGVFRA